MSSGLSCSLDDVKKVIQKWLYLEDTSMVDIMCAGVVANLFQSDPTWLIFIGPPSNAKTELLRMLDGHPGVYFLSNMTPSTLISGKSENHSSLDRKSVV